MKKTQVFFILIGLSVLVASEGKAETVDVKCRVLDENANPVTVGTLHGKSTNETIKQLQKDCQVFPKCTNSSQQPYCVPQVIHPSSQNKKQKKH